MAAVVALVSACREKVVMKQEEENAVEEGWDLGRCVRVAVDASTPLLSVVLMVKVK